MVFWASRESRTWNQGHGVFSSILGRLENVGLDGSVGWGRGLAVAETLGSARELTSCYERRSNRLSACSLSCAKQRLWKKQVSILHRR